MFVEDSVPYFVYACVDVTWLLSLECTCFGNLEGNAFRFVGPDIFPWLIQMAFWRLIGLWVISGDVAFGQHCPSHVVTHFYGFYPRGLDWISTDCVHPFDSLLFGRQVVYAMWHLELPTRCLHGSVWLPLHVVLGQWDPVSALFIYFAYENGLLLTCDEYIFLFIYCDSLITKMTGQRSSSNIISSQHKMRTSSGGIWQRVGQFLCIGRTIYRPGFI